MPGERQATLHQNIENNPMQSSGMINRQRIAVG